MAVSHSRFYKNSNTIVWFSIFHQWVSSECRTSVELLYLNKERKAKKVAEMSLSSISAPEWIDIRIGQPIGVACANGFFALFGHKTLRHIKDNNAIQLKDIVGEKDSLPHTKESHSWRQALLNDIIYKVQKIDTRNNKWWKSLWSLCPHPTQEY